MKILRKLINVIEKSNSTSDDRVKVVTILIGLSKYFQIYTIW